MKVVVFSASADGSKEHRQLAFLLGKVCAEHGWTICNGGGPGLMNTVLQGVTSADGESVSVCLALEGRQHSPLARSILTTNDLRTRQDKLLELGDAFVALPGGIGTIYEVMEILALKNAGMIKPDVPMILLGAFWHDFEDVLLQYKSQGYIKANQWIQFDSVEGCLKQLKLYKKLK